MEALVYDKDMLKIAIIGGGAAGMMAAATICELMDGGTKNERDIEIAVIEKNAILGRKVLISGGGRCNVTTGNNDIKEVLKKYPRGKNFLRAAMYEFSPTMVCKWFENHGVKLKTEKDLRVFPQSNDGRDIVGLFEKILKNHGVKIMYKTVVKSLTRNGKIFEIGLSDDEKIEAQKVILSLGGEAYRHTGSTGDGYSLAESLGHTITPLAPSLSAFMVTENWVKTLSGVSFAKVKLRMTKNEKHEFEGPIIFTHKGISGPAVFALSSLAAYEKIDSNNVTNIFIDFIPDKTYEELSSELHRLMDSEARKNFSTTVATFIPKSFAKNLCGQLEISTLKQNREVSKKDFNKIIEALKNTRLTCDGRVPGDEFVTAGGVQLSEINEKTMESKVCPGLYFAGEILDIDGFTGGYNLQVAWATGAVAGQNATKSF